MLLCPLFFFLSPSAPRAVKNNQFNGSISPGLFGALNSNLYCLETCGINFSGNRFTGRLPPILGDLLQAFVFDFSHNGLTGGIPNKYGYVYSMLQLKLQGNALTGPLPDFNPPSDITYQLMLAQLDLSQNGLTGPLPLHLSRFTRLQQLNVAGNQLYGALPALGGLTRLTYLNFSGNQLSGVPPAYPAAAVLDVSGNFLGGPWASFASQYGRRPVVSLRASGNCFRAPSDAEKRVAAPRGAAECRRFCRADSLQPPCR